MCMLLILVAMQEFKVWACSRFSWPLLFVCLQKLKVLPQSFHKKKLDCSIIFYVTIILCHNKQDKCLVWPFFGQVLVIVGPFCQH